MANNYQQILWDYNITPAEIEKLLKGEIKQVAHYNRDSLFKKMLESYSWFNLVQLIGINLITELLTEDVINKLRTPSLRSKYNYVRKRLQDIIPASG